MADTDLMGRDAVSAVYDDLAGEAVDPPDAPIVSDTPVVEAEPADAPAEKAAPSIAARDEVGRFAKAEAKKTRAAAKAAQASDTVTPPLGVAAPTTPGAQPAGEAEKQPAVKPPASWGPVAREKWAALPPEVQREAAKRETEVTVALRDAAEAKREATGWREAFAPFEAHIRASGVTPVQAAANLFQTEAGLRLGTEQQKAALVANIINSYGVPLEAINAVLTNGPPQQSTNATAQPAQFRDPRFDAYLARQEQKEAQQRFATIKDFSDKHEFFEDLRGDMADLIEAADRRGQTMTLDQAYERASRMNDEVWSTIQDRKSAEAAKSRAPVTSRDRAAASSIRTKPAGGNGVAKTDAKSVISSVYDMLSSR